MRRIIITCILLTGYFSIICSQSASKAINLAKSDFIAKVYNYEKNAPIWVYEGNMPCIVDFYANWCKPCKDVAPVVEEIAKKYQGKIIVYKVNLDKERSIAKALNIESIPTFLFIPVQGEPVIERGAMPLESFEKKINQILLR